MAEIGLIASIVTFAAAAASSAKALCEIVDAIKHAPEEIIAISKDTHAFQEVVSSVELALRDDTVQKVVTGDRRLSVVVGRLEEPLENCKRVLEQLKPRIQAHLKPTSDGMTKISSADMRWYFKKKSIIDRRCNFEATKSTLDAALTAVIFVCNLRATGKEPDTTSTASVIQNTDDTDAGSALLRYVDSIAPRSPRLEGAFGDVEKPAGSDTLAPISSEQRTDTVSRPSTLQTSSSDKLERLRKAENQRIGLHNAAKTGDDLIVQIMLEEGVDVDIRAADGRTALHFAAELGCEDVAQTLLSHHANVNAKSNLAGTDVERKFYGGRTPLHWAATKGHVNIICMLLDHGADVNARNVSGRSALQDATCNHKDPAALLLIERGSALLNRDDENWIPLHEACSGGRIDVVRALVTKGKESGELSAMLSSVTANANMWNNPYVNEVPPLGLATRNNKVDCVEYLVKSGASNDMPKDTPLHVACALGHLAIVRIFIEEAGVDIELRDSVHHETPLLKAASTGQTIVMEYLLHKGADVHARNIYGRSVLEHARSHQPGRNPRAVRFLEEWIASLEKTEVSAAETAETKTAEIDNTGSETRSTIKSPYNGESNSGIIVDVGQRSQDDKATSAIAEQSTNPP